MTDDRSEPFGLDGHESVVELLPWLANGTLSTAEEDGVRSHLSSCVPCRRELAEVERLGSLVRESDDLAPSPERGLARVLATIEADSPAEPPEKAARGLGAGSLRRLVLAQAAVILLLLGALLWMNRAQPAGEYRTLSDGVATEQLGPVVRVVFEATATEDRIRELSTAMGLEVVDGPSPRGVYTLRPLSGTAAVGRLAERLRAEPDVVWAAATSGR